jgi:hypothetical protein
LGANGLRKNELKRPMSFAALAQDTRVEAEQISDEEAD